MAVKTVNIYNCDFCDNEFVSHPDILEEAGEVKHFCNNRRCKEGFIFNKSKQLICEAEYDFFRIGDDIFIDNRFKITSVFKVSKNDDDYKNKCLVLVERIDDYRPVGVYRTFIVYTYMKDFEGVKGRYPEVYIRAVEMEDYAKDILINPDKNIQYLYDVIYDEDLVKYRTMKELTE